MFKNARSEKLYNEYKKRNDIGSLIQLIINERTLPITVREDIINELLRLPKGVNGRPEVSQATFDNVKILRDRLVQNGLTKTQANEELSAKIGKSVRTIQSWCKQAST